MAEVLVVLGGAAAATQLLHYGYDLLIAASALSHNIRHAPQKIEGWMSHSAVMVALLDDIQRIVDSLDPGISGLLEQCRKDTVKLQSLLHPFRANSPQRTPSKMSQRTFVMLKQAEIEQLVDSFRSTFNTLASHFTIVSISRITTQPRPLYSTATGRGNMSNVSLHRFLPRSEAQNLLATLSLLHTSGMSIKLLLNMFDPGLLSVAISTLLSESYVQHDLAKGSININPFVQTTVRSEILVSLDRSRYVASALRSLNSVYHAEFAQPRILRRSHSLSMHASTILDTTMDLPLDLAAFEDAASLAVRYSMYLLIVGHYFQALELIATFRGWCKSRFPFEFDVGTALSGKEAAAQASSGSLNTALRLLRHIHRSRLSIFGLTDIRTLHSMNGLGLVYQALGNNEKATRYHNEALAVKTRILGANDPDTLVSANNLGIVLQSQGDHQTAEKLFSRSLKGWLQAYDRDDLFVIAARSNIGIAHHFQGRLGEAEATHRYVYNERLRILGPTHHETVKGKANLAITINEQGRHAQAAVLYREALATFQDELSHSHPDALKTHTNLATALHDQDKFGEAENVVALVIPLVRAKYGSSHAETLEAMEFRAIILQHLGKFAQAHSVATEVFEARKDKLGYDHDDTQRSLQHVRDLAEDCEEAHVLQSFPTFTLVATA